MRAAAFVSFLLFSLSGNAFAHRFSTPEWEAKFLNCPECWGLSTPDLAQIVPAANSFLVNICWKEAPVTQTIRVDFFNNEPCKNPDGVDQAHALYWLHRNYVGITVTLKLHFEIKETGNDKPSPERARQMLREVRSCIPEIQGVWSRYGIQMNILTDSDFEPSLKGDFLTVKLTDSSGRSDSSNYDYFGYGKGDEAEYLLHHLFCTTMAHETGHSLGLDDEYTDKDCPDRSFTAPHDEIPHSIMDDEYHSWKQLDFYPRHVAAVIAPLCGWDDYE